MKIIHIATAMSFIIMGSCNTNAQVNEQKLTLEAVVKGTYRISDNTEKIHILVDVILKNRSKSPYSFIAYDCEANLSLILNSKLAIICSNKCGGNSPKQINIPENKTLVIPIIIETTGGTSDGFIKPIKVGLVLLQTKDFTEVRRLIYRKKERNEDVIWSEPFYLNDYGQPYAIY